MEALVDPASEWKWLPAETLHRIEIPTPRMPQGVLTATHERVERDVSYASLRERAEVSSRHLLQIDHVLPYGLGGCSDPANLRLLCHAHHRHRHRSVSAVSPTRNPEDPEN